jgi:mRNA-degrading endonuclease RelE of RelBE toxin-antitoxin system
MYSVNINSRAERELKQLDGSIKNRIVNALHGKGY